MIKLGEGGLNAIYPVGSIYLSVNSANPSQLFGGIWEQIAKGRTLIGVDINDADFNTVKKTGGEKTHALTINEIPSHEHSENITSPYGAKVPFTGYYAGGNSVAGYCFSTNSGIVALNQTRIKTDTTGGSQPHNNLQPYFTCYIWCRTA